MSHLFRVSSTLLLAAASSLIVFSGVPNALAADGDRPGIALVKPQAWSPDDQVTVIEFLSYVDRTVKTSPGAGYFEFRTAKSPGIQVTAARVVKLIVFPVPPQTLVLDVQRAELQKQIDEFRALAARVPTVKKILDPSLVALAAEVAKYDAGNVKEEGVWIPRTAYYKKKAAALIELLRPELLAAPSARGFDLEQNQYFLGLEDLAVSEPSVKPLVEGIRAQQAAAVRKEERAEILAKLSQPTLSFSDAEVLVAKLKTLQPSEDNGSSKFVYNWDIAVASAGSLTKEIEAAQAAFESGIVTEEGKVPVLTESVVEAVRKVSASVQQFRAGSPPPAVKVPSDVADVMVACVERLPSVAKQMAGKQYIEAQLILDPLVQKASLIGSKSAAALAALQSTVSTQIDRFRVLRDEAKMLADSDKIEDAIKKYQEAQAIIPEPDIAVQIEALKKQ
ncbi:MAG: hypothetical protein ACOYNN_07135 [Terrimicrobiaceae bacterium]